MEHDNGRFQIGPGAVSMWSVRPVRDLQVSSLYRELLEHVHGYNKRIWQSYRLLHLENPDLPTHVKQTPVAPLKAGDQIFDDVVTEYPLHAFPGSIPHSLMRSEIPIFYNGQRQYVFLYKGDGQRLYLGFTRIRGRPIVFFMTRTAFFYLLPVMPNLPAALFNGTLLDTELIYRPESSTGRRLEVFDAISLCGHLVGHYSYVMRMHLLHYHIQVWDMISKRLSVEAYSPSIPAVIHHQNGDDDDDDAAKQWMKELDIEFSYCFPSSSSSSTTSSSTTSSSTTSDWIKRQDDGHCVQLGQFHLVPKRIYSLMEVDELIYDIIPMLPDYAQEGLIGMPVEDCIMPGPCPRIKKIKTQAKLNSLDLLVGIDPAYFPPKQSQPTVRQVGLWAELPQREVNDASIKIDPKLPTNNFKDTRVILFATYVARDNDIVLVREDGTDPKKYTWDILRGKIVECQWDGKTWVPFRLRDKRKPNTWQTAVRTVENMDLTYQEIFPFLTDRANKPQLRPDQRAMQLDPEIPKRLFQNLLAMQQKTD